MRDNCSRDLYNRSLCDLPAVCQAGKCGKISLDMKKKNVHVKKRHDPVKTVCFLEDLQSETCETSRLNKQLKFSWNSC